MIRGDEFRSLLQDHKSIRSNNSVKFASHDRHAAVSLNANFVPALTSWKKRKGRGCQWRNRSRWWKFWWIWWC